MATTTKTRRNNRKKPSVVDGWPWPNFQNMKDIDNDESEFIHAQNFARYVYKTSELKKFFVEWASKNGEHEDIVKDITKTLDDHHFSMLGQFAWIELQGGQVPERTKKWMVNRIIELKDIAREIKETQPVEDENNNKPEIPKKTAAQTIRENTGNLIAQIEELIDNHDFKEFNLYTTVKSLDHAINAQQIHDYYTPLLNELEEVKKDKELRDAYSNFTDKQLKEFRDFIKQILDDCVSLQQAKKQTRKPRKKKPKSVDKVVQSVKYKKEDPDLKVVSIDPSKVVGVQTLWIYNSKTRFLGVYHAKDEKGLSFKGTTLQNFDEEKSVCKKIRKPDEKIPEFMSAGKPKTKKFLDTINAVEKSLTGRTNEDILFLRIFK